MQNEMTTTEQPASKSNCGCHKGENVSVYCGRMDENHIKEFQETPLVLIGDSDTAPHTEQPAAMSGEDFIIQHAHGFLSGISKDKVVFNQLEITLALRQRDAALLAPHLAKIQELELTVEDLVKCVELSVAALKQLPLSETGKEVVRQLWARSELSKNSLSETTPDTTLESQITGLKEQLAKAEARCKVMGDALGNIAACDLGRMPLIVGDSEFDGSEPWVVFYARTILSDTAGSEIRTGDYSARGAGQTVNLMGKTSEGATPSSPTNSGSEGKGK